MKRKAANNTTDRASNRVRSGTLFRGTAPNFESIPTRRALKGTPKKDGKGGERVTQRKAAPPPLNTSRQSAAALRLQSAARRAMAAKEFRKRLYEYVLLLRKLYMENEISNHALSKIFLPNGNLDVFAAKRLPAKHPLKKLQLKLIDLYKRRNLFDLIEKEMTFGGVAADERIPGHILKGAKDSARDVKTVENLTNHLLAKTNANTNLAQRVLDHLKNSYEQRTLMNERTFQNLNNIPKLNDLKNRKRIAENIAKFSHDDRIPDYILKDAKDSARDVKTVEDLTSHLFQTKDANKNLAQRLIDDLKRRKVPATNKELLRHRFRLIDNRANKIAKKIMFNTTNGDSSDSDGFDNSLRLSYQLHRLEKNKKRQRRGVPATNQELLRHRFRLIDNRANKIAKKIMFNTTNGDSSDSDGFDNSLRLSYQLHRLEKNKKRQRVSPPIDGLREQLTEEQNKSARRATEGENQLKSLRTTLEEFGTEVSNRKKITVEIAKLGKDLQDFANEVKDNNQFKMEAYKMLLEYLKFGTEVSNMSNRKKITVKIAKLGKDLQDFANKVKDNNQFKMEAYKMLLEYKRLIELMRRLENEQSTTKKKIQDRIRHSITKDRRLMMRMAPETVVYGNFGYENDRGNWKDPERILSRALKHPTAKKQRKTLREREGFTSKSVHDIRIDESYGNSALPSKAEGRSKGNGRPYSGKERVPSNTLTLYHVTKKQPLDFKAGDAIEFKGSSFWHSDPGFKWMGRRGGVVRGGLQGGLFQGTFAPVGRTIPKGVIKLVVPAFPLPEGLVRSTNVHNTNFGTTFKLRPTRMYIASSRLLHNGNTKEFTAYIISNSSWFDRSTTPDYSPNGSTTPDYSPNGAN